MRFQLFILGIATSAHADLIPIVNPSFELTSRPLEVGQQTNGAGGVGVPVATRFPFGGGPFSWDNPVEIPGWRTLTTQPGNTAIVYAGVLNPPLLGGEPFITNQDGQHVAALQVARMGQTLTTQIAPNTRYTLRFRGGIGRFGSDYFLSASLIVVPDLVTLPHEGQPGVVRLVLSMGYTPPPQSFGTMLPYSIEYTSPAVLPANLAGKYLGIHMWGSDGIPRVLYDDFVLEATPVGSCYANCDGSTGTPLLTANDFQCFINEFAQGSTRANCDGSTSAPTLTANDFQCFLNTFAAGCS